jgi:fatty acid amide hydrolase 2
MRSRDVVQAHIDAIRRNNPRLNAVVAERFDAALVEADEADATLPVGDERPFHGVPCTVKEAFALVGMPHTSGLRARQGIQPSEDATAVQRMRAAGFIPLGVTNTSELCMWMESSNPVYGRCNNPYDSSRTSGGSSGGEGAIVGSGASPIGLGSDVGGSIRIPAFFCGVFGHKPTGGLVPSTGQYPPATNDVRRYLATGPLARRAEDLYPFLRVIAGPDGQDGGCIDWELGDPASLKLKGLPVLQVAGNGLNPVSRPLRLAQRKVARHLESCGAEVTEFRSKTLRHSLEIWSTLMELGNETPFRVLLGNGEAVSASRDLWRHVRGDGEHTLAALFLCLIEQLPLFNEARAERLVEMATELRLDLEDRMADGVMLYPSYSRLVPPHSVALLHPTAWVYTAIINTLQLPATQVPLGLGPGHLPLGVQVVAPRGKDHRSIGVALELERAFGGWRQPAPTT